MAAKLNESINSFKFDEVGQHKEKNPSFAINQAEVETEKLFELIRKSEIGANTIFQGPFGFRRSYIFLF